jgi:hypothetical protein
MGLFWDESVRISNETEIPLVYVIGMARHGRANRPSTCLGLGKTSTCSAVMVSPTWPGAGLGLSG